MSIKINSCKLCSSKATYTDALEADGHVIFLVGCSNNSCKQSVNKVTEYFYELYRGIREWNKNNKV